MPSMTEQLVPFKDFPVASAYLQQIIERSSPDYFTGWDLMEAERLVEMFGTTPVKNTVFSISEEAFISADNAKGYAAQAKRQGRIDLIAAMPETIKNVPYEPPPFKPHHSDLYRDRIKPGMSSEELGEISAASYMEWKSAMQDHTSFYLFGYQALQGNMGHIFRSHTELDTMEPVPNDAVLIGRYAAGFKLPDNFANKENIMQGILYGRTYTGEIVEVAGKAAIQSVGKQTFIVHDIARLDRAPAVGEKLRITYNENGRATLVERSGAEKALSR